MLIRDRARFRYGGGDIQDSHAPGANAISHGPWLRIANTQFSQSYCIYRCAAGNDRFDYSFVRPFIKWRVQIGYIDEYVCVEEDHGSRVSVRSCSQERVGLSGASFMAFRHASRFTGDGASGTVMRTSTTRSSFSCRTSYTSPGRPFGRTTRFFESTREMLMVGLSHPNEMVVNWLPSPFVKMKCLLKACHTAAREFLIHAVNENHSQRIIQSLSCQALF